MSLSRQLIIVLMCLLLTLIASMFALNIKHVQRLLSKQMDVQTQNSANSLALSLKAYMTNNDIQGAGTFVDGFFNHGFYQKLSITDAHKTQAIIERSNPGAVHGAPEWFVHLISLQGPQKKAEIVYYDRGHLQKSLVLLEASSSFAYEQLWLAIKEWFILSAILISVAALLLVALVRWQLSPLKVIEQQALAISHREFAINRQTPRARELKSVVLAMNDMSSKLKHFIDELTKRAEQLLLKTRIDSLTGLMNRQSFMDNLHAAMNENGAIAIVHIHGLNHINDTHGYPTGNELLRAVARMLNQQQELYTEAFAGRISGADFALAAPGLNTDEFDHVFNQLKSGLKSLSVPDCQENLNIIAGIASYAKEQDISTVLAKANHALSMAMHQEKSLVYIADDDHAPSSFASTDWGELIDHTIEGGRLTLTSQDVIDVHGETLFHCLLVKPDLPDEENMQTASFIAMTERLGRGIEFDRLVAGKVFQHASTSSDSAALSIKLLASSWYDIEFLAWFLDLLEQYPSVANRLFISCTAASLIRDVKISKNNIDSIRELGGRIIMDHFGSELSSFAALRQLNPDYIKLDGNYIRDVNQDDDHKMFIRTVANIAHGLDIGVIAEHVETDAIKPVLEQMEIDAFQGYAISKIQLLAE